MIWSRQWERVQAKAASNNRQATKRGVLADRLIGDGLVPLRSALGQHNEGRRNLAFAKTSHWIGHRMNHQELLSSPKVTRKMVQWLTPLLAKNRLQN